MASITRRWRTGRRGSGAREREQTTHCFGGQQGRCLATEMTDTTEETEERAVVGERSSLRIRKLDGGEEERDVGVGSGSSPGLASTTRQKPHLCWSPSRYSQYIRTAPALVVREPEGTLGRRQVGRKVVGTERCGRNAAFATAWQLCFFNATDGTSCASSVAVVMDSAPPSPVLVGRSSQVPSGRQCASLLAC